MRRDAFHAIADPTRREILYLLKNKELNINAVAENFEISRPAISKQMKILEECGMIIIHRRGRERYCTAKMDQLNEVSAWIEKYRDFWKNKLDALEIFLEISENE